MPSADQHRKKAEKNRALLALVSPNDYPDWVVVIAFYTAVHLVERLRAASGDGHSRDHADRLAYVHMHHSTIHTAYYQLQNASMLARYQSNADFFRQFHADEVTTILIDRYLTAVEKYVKERLDN